MKFAQYLTETQTPEWKKAYIDYRGLKKRITAVRRAQHGQQTGDSSSDGGESRSPQAPPTTPRASSSIVDSKERSGSITLGLPPLPKHKRVPTSSQSSGAMMEPTQVSDSGPATGRKSISKTEDPVGHSTGVQDSPRREAPPPMPRRGSIFGRASHAIARSISSQGGIPAVPPLPYAVKASNPLSLHDLMSHLSPHEVAFFVLLDAQLDKVESFYTAREKEMAARSKSLEEQLRELEEHKRLFLSAHTKVPWAAAFTYALRPNKKQLKITRTMSLSEDSARHSSSTSVMNRLWNALSPRKPRRIASTPSLRHRDSKPCLSDAQMDEEKREETGSLALPTLMPPFPIDNGQHDRGSESGIRFADEQNGNLSMGLDRSSPPRSPASPAFAPDADNYLYAKRKLKKAAIEHYRGLELLHNYRVLNLTGFRKALKKFEKVTKIPVQDQYMSEKVEKSALASDKVLQKMIREMEEMYAMTFVHGNKKKALKRLRGGTRVKSHHFSTFRSGLMLGLAVPAFVAGLYSALQQETQQKMDGWGALLNVYAILLVPTLFAAVLGLNLLVWTRSRINYIFIFELNVSTCMDYREYFEIPCFLLALLACAFWLSFTQIGGESVSPTVWPLVWLGISVLVLLNPFPILYRSSRYWLARVVGKLFLSGTRRVEFTDFWLGDQFCSLMFTLSNIYFVGCAYADGFSSDWRKCGSASNLWPVAYVLAVLPYFIRLVQSVKRYSDSGLVTHLINAGKYGSGMVSYLLYSLWRHQGAPRFGVLFALWCFLNVVATLYNTIWDFLMDWSVLRVRSPNFLLRQDLVYSDHISFYYFAIVSNVILRFSWLLFIPAAGPDMQLRSFVVGLLEMLRRVQWNFYRLENEHLGNMDQYRVTREVPLPYLFDDPHREDDGDEEETRKR